jgi:HK97 family phage major capsid protein
MASVKELTAKRATAFESYKGIIAKKDDEKRDYTADETAQLETLDNELDSLTEQIEALQQDETRRDRLEHYQSIMDENVERQTLALKPGHKRGSDAYTVKMLRPKLFGSDEVQEFDFAANSSEGQRSSPEYQKAFLSFLRSGQQQLGLMVGDDTKGGYLAPPSFMAELIKFLDNQVFMRGLCRTIMMPGVVNLGVPSWDTDPNDADWTAEVPASDISEDTAARVGKRELSPNLLTKLIKMSKKMLASSAIPIQSLITERLGYKFAITEEQAFLTGDGAQQPLGIFTASANGIPTTRNITAASTTTVTGDELINTLYNLKAGYQLRSTWVVHRDFIKLVRKLKDGNSQYLWSPGLGGQPSTLLDRPYVMSEYAPNTFTTGLYVAIVGDFSNYWILDSMGLEIQSLNELFSLKNQVGFLGRKETDAMPVLGEAFSRLILA